MLIRRIPDKNKAAHEGIWMKEAKGSYELQGKNAGNYRIRKYRFPGKCTGGSLGMKVIFYDMITKLPLGNAVARKTLEGGFIKI